MISAKPFLLALRAKPTDWGTRLVYADWLEERGRIAETFLQRATVRTATLPPSLLGLARVRLRDNPRPTVEDYRSCLAQNLFTDSKLLLRVRPGEAARMLGSPLLTAVPGMGHYDYGRRVSGAVRQARQRRAAGEPVSPLDAYLVTEDDNEDVSLYFGMGAPDDPDRGLAFAVPYFLLLLDRFPPPAYEWRLFGDRTHRVGVPQLNVYDADPDGDTVGMVAAIVPEHHFRRIPR